MKVKFFKKAGSAILAAALAANFSAIGSSVFSSIAADSTKYEFEDGTLSGATIQEEGTDRYAEGASGDKFVFLQDSGETAAVTVTVEETGMYNIILCYSAPYGSKIHNLYVNGVDQGQFSCVQTDSGEWVELDLGSVKFTAGENEILIKSSWGWTDIDYITIEASDLPDIVATQVTCCDPEATEEAQNLMSYLASVYGEHIISGQQEIYMYGPHDFEYEFEYIEDLTRELPAIRGFDFLNQANILYGSDDGTTDRMIDWAVNKGGIVTASWHLTVPVDFTNYELGVTSVDWSNATYAVWNGDEPATDFDTSNAIVEGTKEYEYYMACLEALASCIQELDDAGVPLIFRPLHEAEGSGGESGSWFWWGQDGSEVYKELWKLTYTTLTETYGLHNIIWEWNSYAYSTSEDWYPGDEYVDLIAYDKYNCTDWSTGSAVLTHNDSAISSTFYTIMEKYDSKKMVAMSENDSIPALANLIDEKAGWLYFCPWYDGGSDSTNFLTNEVFNTQEDLIEMYQSDYCITLGELPADLYSNGVDVTTTTTMANDSETTTTTTTTTTTSDPDKYVFELFSETVDISGRSENAAYSLIIELEGTPEASIGGCVGYSTGSTSDDWVNIEWSGNFDSDGKLTISVPLNDVSTDVSTAEVQVWWSNLWDSDTETANDVPCEITDIIVDTDEAELLYGDANLNGTVDITDAVQIMSYISNSEKYPLTDEQINVSDVNQRGNRIDNLDALAVQRLISNNITSLPESYLSEE